MDNLKPYLSLFITFVILVVLILFYFLMPNFLNSNFFMGIITFVVGFFVIYLYIKQKEDSKKDAAKIILQEIRREQNIIYDFKEHRQFKFTKKIIANNSWGKNIHYFVDDLAIDELDKISNLYSTGEYLDSVIKMVSDIKFDNRIHENLKRQAKTQVEQQLRDFAGQLDSLPQSGSEISGSTGGIAPQSLPQPLSILPRININVNLRFDSVPTDILFMQIVSSYEPIYHSDICLKLKRIAGVK